MFRLASPWPWVAHPVSCLIPATIRPIKTRFRYGFGCHFLNLATEINSQAHSPRGTPSGIAPRTRFLYSTDTLLALRLIVSLRFQVLFHSPNRGTFHLSLTVLVHYRCIHVFSLGSWSTRIPTELECSMVLRNQLADSLILHTRLSLPMATYSMVFYYQTVITYRWPCNPPICIGV